MTTFIATISIVNIVLGYLLARSLHKGQAPLGLSELQQDAFFEQDSLLAEDPRDTLDADPALTDIATVDIEAQPNSLEAESDDQNEVLEEVDSQQNNMVEQPVDTNPRPEIIAEESEEAEAVEELLTEEVEDPTPSDTVEDETDNPEQAEQLEPTDAEPDPNETADVEQLLAESVEEKVDPAAEKPSELPVEEETLQELEALSEQPSEQTGDSAQHATAPNEHNSSEDKPSEATSEGELMAGVEAFREQLAKMKE